MKLIVIVCVIISVAFCAPTFDPFLSRRALPALEHEEVHDEFGQYAYRYVTAEGTVVSQRAWLEPTENGTYVLVTEGEVSYLGDDGEIYVTKYYAGINGTHVENNHYPVPKASVAEESDESQ
ncbi:uncharacterized protein LOC119831283 [Zerene cesonia]|uniref:uncharacterized protein LOC119831283 n=1 Tax=Zerene cesonia TaxID=33412 RepID=UPI0018E55719|nr:uncharacterized protein LOC119831283 [Zerene cesonia]